MASRVVSTALWVLAGAFVGAVLAPLSGRIHQYWFFTVLFGVMGAVYGNLPLLRGKIGVPLVAVAAGLTGWLIGFVTNVWQVGAVGVILGVSAGALFGMRLQDRFTRNTARGSGSGGFYR